MSKLFIIRHARAIGNAEGIMMGSSQAADKGLAKEGKGMAIKKAAEFEKNKFMPGVIFCSELPRARQTAQIIAETLGIEPRIVVMPELNERSFGKYEGKPYQAAIDAFDREGTSPKTMEPVDDFIKRVLKGFELVKDQAEENTLAVTHSNPLAVIRSFLYYPDDLRHYWDHETDAYVSGLELTA